MFKKIKDVLLYQEKEQGPTPNQILQQIIGVLAEMDSKIEATMGGIQAMDHHMQIIHERQLAILEKLNFMVRVEEGQITKLVKDMEQENNRL